jgi:tRNA-specific 2-thiouridylase
VHASAEDLLQHLEHPLGRGHMPHDAFTGAAGGAACGDLIRISIAVDRDSVDGVIRDVGFDASGCGALVAAGSAVVAMVRDLPLLAAAKIGAREVVYELGGLIPAKRHAAELAADALHRALGSAARTGTQLAEQSDRTIVAMSGGVDSAVAALLVAETGAEPVGVTLELWSDPENDGDLSCCSAQAVRGARELAHGLGMAHLSIDLRAEFRAGVVDGWLADHAAGLTPNPCVRCNGRVRLDAMLELARRLGSETLATGHYARVEGDAKRPLLRVAADPAKDQSYVLCALEPDSLARLQFPLGDLHKPQVRELATRAGLSVASKRDSQDLCFLAGTRHGDFLERHGGLGKKPGPILDEHGSSLGEHAGAHAYTVGQRHGLGISAPQPLYVLATDAIANTVTVGPRAQLLTHELSVRDAVLHSDGRRVDAVRVRAHGRRFPCRLPDAPGAGHHERLAVRLDRAAERTAPGQIACLFSGDLLIGHGTIT